MKSHLRPLSPAHLRLIDALAAKMVRDHLTAETALRRAEAEKRTNHVPLLPADKAA